jgi:hypothetical protein
MTAIIVVAGLIAGMTATGASAALPEFGRCLPAESTTVISKSGKEKVVFHGKYSNKGCTHLNHHAKGHYEWNPGPGPKNHFFGIGEEPEPLLETTGGEKIICGTAQFIGEYTGPKSMNVSVTLAGCNTAKSNKTCQTESSINGGEITPKTGFVGELGQVKADPKKPTVGWLIKPKEGTTMWEFYCGDFPTPTEPLPSIETKWTVEGSVIGVVLKKAFFGSNLNKMNKISAVGFTQSHGVQSPTSFEGGSPTEMKATIINVKKFPPTTVTEQLGFETVAELGSGTGESHENPEVEEPSEIKTI